MNPHKRFGVQQFLEAFHRPAQDKGFTVRMHAHIVTGGVYPGDRIDVYAIGLPAILNGESSWKSRFVSACFDKGLVERELLPGELADKFQELRPVSVGLTLI